MPATTRATNGDVQRSAIFYGGHRPVGLTADRPADLATAWPGRLPEQRTVVALDDIRLSDPPPDAALVVVLPRFAPHSALDQAADLGITADWPILGVIGIRRRSWLATQIARLTARLSAPPDARTPDAGVPDVAVPDARAPEAEEHQPVPGLGAPDDIHREREDD